MTFRGTQNGFYPNRMFNIIFCISTALSLAHAPRSSAPDVREESARDLPGELLVSTNRRMEYILTKISIQSPSIFQLQTKDRSGSIQASPNCMQYFLSLVYSIASSRECLPFPTTMHRWLPSRLSLQSSDRTPGNLRYSSLENYLAICRLQRYAQCLTSCRCGEITKDRGHHNAWAKLHCYTTMARRPWESNKAVTSPRNGASATRFPRTQDLVRNGDILSSGHIASGHSSCELFVAK